MVYSNALEIELKNAYKHLLNLIEKIMNHHVLEKRHNHTRILSNAKHHTNDTVRTAT